MAFHFNSDTQQQVPDMAPPPERVGWFYAGILLTFVVLIGVWLAWKPAAGAVRSMLAGQEAAAAQTAISEQDWSRAAHHLVQARQKAPDDAAVIRAMVAFYQATGTDPAGLAQQLRLLAAQQPLSTEEELLLGNALLATGKTTEAREVYAKLPADNMPQPRLKLLSSILKAEGHTQEAAVIERRALAQDTGTPAARLSAALEDLGSHFPEVRQQARQELWQLAELSSATGLEAGAKLAADRALTPLEAERLLDLVTRHPLENLPARLGVVSAMLRLRPEQRSQIVKAEIERFQARKEGRLEELAYWLMAERQHTEVFQLVSKDLAMKSRELYPILMQSLSHEQRWEELKALLGVPHPPVAQSLVSIALAEVHSHLEPDLQRSRLLLAGTIESAKHDGNVAVLQAVAALAEKLNLSDLALTARQLAGETAAAAGQTEAALQNLQQSARLALQTKDGGILLASTRQLHELVPSSAVYADRLTYVRLILGVEMETIDLNKDVDTEAAVTTQAHIPLPLLRALAAYRMGDLPAVAGHLGGLEDVTRLEAGQRAVAAGLLSLAGRPDRAFQIAEKIPAALLLREEQAFLQRAR